jgi:acetyltransferase-like isoleucine patch superfamily enzyme
VPANSIAVGVPARILPRQPAGQAKRAQRTG